MKTQHLRRFSRLPLLVLSFGFLFMPAESQARPPRARERTCIVQTIEHESRTMSLRCDKETKPLELVWKKDTKFLKEWKSTDVASLKAGQAVVVYYRSPFFGKKFVTKVVWQNG